MEIFVTLPLFYGKFEPYHSRRHLSTLIQNKRFGHMALEHPTEVINLNTKKAIENLHQCPYLCPWQHFYLNDPSDRFDFLLSVFAWCCSNLTYKTHCTIFVLLSIEFWAVFTIFMTHTLSYWCDSWWNKTFICIVKSSHSRFFLCSTKTRSNLLLQRTLFRINTPKSSRNQFTSKTFSMATTAD